MLITTLQFEKSGELLLAQQGQQNRGLRWCYINGSLREKKEKFSGQEWFSTIRDSSNKIMGQ